MDSFTVITNNSSLPPNLFEGIDIEQVGGGPETVYAALQHKLSQGYLLVSAPLPVNVPLIRSPVRSVIVRKHSAACDQEGLWLVENASRRTEALSVPVEDRHRRDQEMIDKDQLMHAVRDLQEFLGA